ncbi:Syntaxin-binding protein 4 [Takifugu flavidus]|uniref:Syntaxin-binding protein 4 n=1 Tax=Takifugu flavidus TaxID=433684 RepID=A0A5C6PR86_9TELE|nr:Syntaxin-binding protein 4 [Takifugu flavidus]
MPLLPQDKNEPDGLSLLYWTIMGPHGANRAVQRLEFRDCRKGLGVKIIGGYKEQSGEQFGVYIKRVVSGGLAALDGRLKAGDLILDVNNISLVGVTNERAVEILRMASLSNHMSLLIARDEESRTQFVELMEKCSSGNSSLTGQISPLQLSTGPGSCRGTLLLMGGWVKREERERERERGERRGEERRGEERRGEEREERRERRGEETHATRLFYIASRHLRLADTASSSSSSRSESPQLLGAKEGLATHSHAPPQATNTPQSSQLPSRVFSDSTIQLICVAKATGLGLVIKGGANRADGPMVFIQELMPGGDCQKDGRLQVGDQLVSINKESLIGVTYEEARSILTRTKLRPDPTVEIAFIRRSLWSGSSRGSPNTQASTGAVTRHLGVVAAPLQSGTVTKVTPGEQPIGENLPAVSESQARVHPVRAEQSSLAPPEGDTATQSSCEAAGGQPHQSWRLKLNHLEQALDVFGLKPSEAQQQVLRSRLKADPAGTVAFTDFQILIHEMFLSQLDQLEVTSPRSRLFGLLDSPGNLQVTNPQQQQPARLPIIHPQIKTNLAFEAFPCSLTPSVKWTLWLQAARAIINLPPRAARGVGFKRTLQHRVWIPPQMKTVPALSLVQTSLSDSEELEEMEQLRKEHIEALREMKRLQEQLVESQRVHHQMEEELNNVKQEMELLRTEESQALTTQIQLAEEAQKQARGMEMDYEEVIHLLEAEIAELKSQGVEPSLLTNKEEKDELKKKIAILECQLRKSEAARRRFEVSVGKLLSFVENVQEFLLENLGPPKSYSSGDLKVGASSLNPPYKKSPWTSASLAQEAKELSRTVRSMMEVDCLPYGSEEAYTADGVKYYINHVTQTTSWSLDVPGSTGTSGLLGPPEVSDLNGWDEEENKSGSAVETDM